MDKKTKWSLAAKYGLILSSVTVIVSLLGMLNLPGIVVTLITIAKFAAIAYLLHRFMTKYSQMTEGSVSYGASFKFGFLICFLSSIVCTTYSYIDYTLFRPELIETMIETMLAVQGQMGATGGVMMDYQTLSSLMPKTIIFSLFFNYIIFGLIFPAIIANYTKKELFEMDEDIINTNEE